MKNKKHPAINPLKWPNKLTPGKKEKIKPIKHIVFDIF